jgi:hypothetical protein
MNNDVIIMIVFVVTVINAALIGKMGNEVKELQEKMCELSIDYCKENSDND